VGSEDERSDPSCWVRERRQMDEARRNNKENSAQLRAMESTSRVREKDFARGGIAPSSNDRRTTTAKPAHLANISSIR
jgi:hypothetical protein